MALPDALNPGMEGPLERFGEDHLEFILDLEAKNGGYEFKNFSVGRVLFLAAYPELLGRSSVG